MSEFKIQHSTQKLCTSEPYRPLHPVNNIFPQIFTGHDAFSVCFQSKNQHLVAVNSTTVRVDVAPLQNFKWHFFLGKICDKNKRFP